MGGLEDNLVCHPWKYYPFPFIQSLLLASSSQIRLDWQASDLKDSPFSTSVVLGLYVDVTVSVFLHRF